MSGGERIRLCVVGVVGMLCLTASPAVKPDAALLAAYEEACRGVTDGGRFVRIVYPDGGFPLAKNTDGGVDSSWNGDWRKQPGKCRTAQQRAFVVPAALYCAVRLVVSVDPSPGLDRVFTVRLTRYVDGPGFTGRDFAGMMNVEVDFDRATKRRLPDGTWELDVPLDMGDVYDLVWNDDHGTWLNNRMRAGQPKALDVPVYLDFEVLSRLVRFRSPMRDSRMQPDVNFRNALTVRSAVLEKAGAALMPLVTVPGNVFEGSEKPETKVRILVRRPGAYDLSWEIRDAEDKPVGEGRRTVSADTDLTVDLAPPGPGWYSLVYTLSEKGRPLARHHASFAVLAADTRQEGVGEGPYGSGTYGGNHYCVRELDFLGPLMRKAGFRRGGSLARYPAAERHAYLLSPQAVIWDRRAKLTEAERVAEIGRSVRDDPNVRTFTLLHEDAPNGSQQAWELTGQAVPDPKTFGKAGWSVAGKLSAEEHFARRRRRHEFVNEIAGIVRRHFPGLRITLGNSLASTELIAETVRDGFPEEFADYMGVESVVRTQLPEREGVVGMQIADAFLQTARALGRGKWKVNATWESVFRIDSLLGADRQAAWYVRDLLLEQAWRFPDVFIGNLMDCGNEYGGSFWGTSGLCGRAPYAYPKKSYVGVAVATRLLDRVDSVRCLQTGDDCVYAVEYARRDGRRVCAFWTSRGRAALELKLAGTDVEFIDFYGRPFAPKMGRIVAGEFPAYAVSVGSPVALAKVLDYRYERDKPRAGARLVAAADDPSAWRMETEANAFLEKTTGPFLPYRTKGAYALRGARDAKAGGCLELELSNPDLKLPTVMEEYAVVRLKDPVRLDEKTHTLGALVKGNSGWGKFFFVVEDAKGRTYCSCGVKNGGGVDYEGQMSMCYTGWNYIEMPLSRNSPVRNLTTGTTTILWGGTMVPPLKLTGFGFSAQSRPLFLTTRKPTHQAIRIGGIYALEAGTRLKEDVEK